MSKTKDKWKKNFIAIFLAFFLQYNRNKAIGKRNKEVNYNERKITLH